MSIAGFSSLLHPHQDLPPGVHSYPTLKGQRRFEMLEVFNWALAGYITIHQLLVPIVIYYNQVGVATKSLSIGYWYLYHYIIAGLLFKTFRSPRACYLLVYLAWFGMGFLPFQVFNTLFLPDGLNLTWKAISGLLCFGSSLLFTVFLLYRLRMPTTAYLFHMKEDRLIPKWRYMIPNFLLGVALGLPLVL